MTKDRRSFLKKLTRAGVGAMVPFGAETEDTKGNTQLGLQLWTIQSMMTRDVGASLALAANIGYNSIETFGFDGKFHGYAPKDFKTLCNDLELKLYSAHTDFSSREAVLEGAAAAGLEYLVHPGFEAEHFTTEDGVKKLAEQAIQLGEKCQDAGLRFAYHNHNYEFTKLENEQTALELFLSLVPPELVSFQMDTYWFAQAGQSPSAYLEKFPDHFELMHLKDINDQGESCALGTGKLDFEAIVSLALATSLRYAYVEQEHYVYTSLLDDIRKSAEFVKAKL